MPLPESYTIKPGSIPAYFDALLDAQPPERFSVKFFENLGFTSTNDRLFIGILKDLGFLNRDGEPQPRYYSFLDRSQARLAVAEGIKEGFSDLFAINKNANAFKVDDVKNKLRSLFAGKKTDLVISHIAKTFRALCDYADFSKPKVEEAVPAEPAAVEPMANTTAPAPANAPESQPHSGRMKVSSLQYHINVVLPDTRDQAVYDAIFKSLREHLG